MSKKSLYKIEFSIDNLTLYQQELLFKKILKQLDYDKREDLHVTVTDSIGGKHMIWDNIGIDPKGKKCSKCNCIDCEDCMIFLSRTEVEKNA